MSDSLYDATVTDGHCRVRVSFEPSLNRLIHRNRLRCGSVLRNVVLSAPEGGERDRRTFHICSLDVDSSGGSDAALLSLSSVNVDSLPWVMGEEPSLVPLRARRSSYLPQWNNHDFSGETWRHAPPAEDSDDEEGMEGI